MEGGVLMDAAILAGLFLMALSVLTAVACVVVGGTPERPKP